MVALLVWWVLFLHEPPGLEFGWTRFAVYLTEEQCEAGRSRFIAAGRTTEESSRCETSQQYLRDRYFRILTLRE
jgi:hypothetical protein